MKTVLYIVVRQQGVIIRTQPGIVRLQSMKRIAVMPQKCRRFKGQNNKHGIQEKEQKERPEISTLNYMQSVHYTLQHDF